jgi:hypothetical protein
MPAFTTMIGDGQPAPRPTRSTPALLIGALVVLLGSAPGLRAQSASPSNKAPSKPAVVEKTKAVAELEPFDLSFVPIKARCIIAIRPSVIFRRKELKQYRDVFQEVATLILTRDADLQIPIKLESIEQVTFVAMPPSHAERKGGIDDSDDRVYLSIRFARDVDLQRSVKRVQQDLVESDAAWEKVTFEGRTYQRAKGPKAPPADAASQAWCVFLPDAHTVVMADEESLRALIQQPAGSLPEPARGSGWQEVRRGLFALVSADGPEDDPDGFSALMLQCMMDIVRIMPQNPRRISCGIDEDETLRLHISEDSGGVKEASDAALQCLGRLARARFMLAVGSPEVDAELDKGQGLMLRLIKELSGNCEVRSEGRVVEVVTRCKVPLAELLDLFCDDLDVKALVGDLRKTTPGKDQKPAKR